MDPIQDPSAFGDAVRSAVDGQQWVLVVALVVFAAVSIARRLGALQRVPDKYLPLVATAVSVLGTTAAAIVNGDALLPAVIAGVVAGTSAVGLHQTQHQVRSDKKPGTVAIPVEGEVS